MAWLTDQNGKLTQGTVIDNVDWGNGVNPLSIVMSNPCDLEYGKASFLLVAALIPANNTLQITKEFQNKVTSANANKQLSKGSWKALFDYLASFIHNKNIVRYFTIDPNEIIDSDVLFVDFQLLKSIPISQIEGLNLIAQLPSPFVEKMITHFASYISRIGVDRVSEERQKTMTIEIASPYHSES